jgi:AraC-like DNA-binding protein
MAVLAKPQRTDVRTADRDVAAEAINRIAAHQACISFDDPAAVDLRVHESRYGDIDTSLIRFGGVRYEAAADPMPFLLAGFVAEGGARVQVRAETVPLPRGEGMLYPVGVPTSGGYGDATFVLLRLPVGVVADLAEETTGLPAADLRFHGMTPVSAELRQFWGRTADFVWRQLSIPGLEPPPLVTTQFVRLVGSALLTVFPNTTMTGVANDGGHVGPAVLRRATAFIEAHPEDPLTVGQIAAAAGVGIRAVQSAFRRHLGVTPMAYLRRVRLERVHRDLRAGDPFDGVTVQDVARRWGFANLGRFAAEYRAEYDETPSRTLRG